MTPHQKLFIAHARLIGEFTGTLEGLLWHNITEDVKEIMRAKIEELKAMDTSEYMPELKEEK